MSNYKLIIPGAVAVMAGLVILLGIWFPQLRFVHKGSSKRLGKLSTASAAFLPLGWGVLLVWLSFRMNKGFPAGCFVGVFILSILGAMCGHFVDRRSDHE